jgi:hypothetical protein
MISFVHEKFQTIAIGRSDGHFGPTDFCVGIAAAFVSCQSNQEILPSTCEKGIA